MLSQEIFKWIEEAARKLGYPIDLAAGRWKVEHPDDLARGDYATNVALVLGKEMKKNPVELAEQIVQQILKVAPLESLKVRPWLRPKARPWLERVEVAPPGFINFFLTRDFFASELSRILEQGDKYGKGINEDGKKIMIEYTDPNPFKEFHLGHLMSNTIGEAISRLVASQGADVKRACYQGDVGMHVAKAIWGHHKIFNSQFSISETLGAKDWGEAYAVGAQAYESDESAKPEINEINKKVYDRSDEAINQLYDQGRQTSLDYFETIYKRLDTKFDYYFFESETGKLGKKLVEENIGQVFEKSDGAIIFPGENYALHTRVFLTKENLPTYEAKELGLAKLKFERYPCDQSVVITGNEVTNYFAVVKKALELIFPDLAKITKHLPHGMLRLTTGKMSSRTGEVITAESLLESVKGQVALKIKDKYKVTEADEIAEKVSVAAIKYWILKQAPGRDVIFNPRLALSFEGSSGPYLQYALVRARSVVVKASAIGLRPDVGNSPPVELTTFERLLHRFPETAARAARDYAPQFLVTYLVELAAAFNNYYAAEQIIGADSGAPYRLALTQAVATVLANGLNLLAISIPDRM